MNQNKIVMHVVIGLLISIAGRYAIPPIYKAFKKHEVIECSQLVRPDGKSDEKEYCLNGNSIVPSECYFEGYGGKGCEILSPTEAINTKNEFVDTSLIPNRPSKCTKANNNTVQYCLDNSYRLPLECYFDEKDNEKCVTLQSLYNENIEKGFIHQKENNN